MDIEKSAEDWKKEGNTAFSAKNYLKAIECYTYAIKLNPNDHSYFSNRATSYFNRGDYLSCISDCESCLNIKSNFGKAFRRKGLACCQLLRFAEAITAFRSAVELEKEQAVINEMEEAEHFKSNFDRYLAAVQKQDFAEAMPCINHLVAKIPNSETLKLYKVECLAKTGETTDALTLLKSIESASNSSP